MAYLPFVLRVIKNFLLNKAKIKMYLLPPRLIIVDKKGQCTAELHHHRRVK